MSETYLQNLDSEIGDLRRRRRHTVKRFVNRRKRDARVEMSELENERTKAAIVACLGALAGK